MKFVLLFFVVATCADAASLKAPRLSPPLCACDFQPDFACGPAPTDCELTDDYCGCCPVCALQEGQTCGVFSAGCAGGLTCVLEECNPEVVDVTLADGTVTQQVSQPPCLFLLPYFQRGECQKDDTAVPAKRQAVPFGGESCEVRFQKNLTCK
ncbi:PREDICTED: serine protease HTRA1-like [Branchiostoma belcheri]|uniref:Serine protease HTRA1-like n=1 Tax=Branchiostoma belcheri TaxID=7741 RepID=A0A6P4ZGM4_BRABE|nr:PREDICTED: serine protease HTRA1-like [Branchiostoma belcheri]